MPATDLHGRVFPIMPSRDVDETVGFYGRLGFSVISRFGGRRIYLIVERDGVFLHFFHFPSVDPPSNICGCYLQIADVDALYGEWSILGLARLAPPQDRGWGMREFSLVDPSGNLIRVGSAQQHEQPQHEQQPPPPQQPAPQQPAPQPPPPSM